MHKAVRAWSIQRSFRAVSQQSTELHFMPVEQQFEGMEQQAALASQFRDSDSSKSKGKLGLQPGDCYITKHSSLAEVHIVFHLIRDDASLLSGDVTSRHPVILGLRNVLKQASSYDITCLSIPLLLVHEMSEEMTVAWCARRAELVFKCIKGFMIETASWGGSELKTLQFILPKGISEDLFGNLATMLPSIFRVANPLKFKANNK
ncbi:hypothetical protein B566_EDAN007281 [Ephemera danica]|nr:hypothetical protein B566_EDAN007281 [Ephemera danica]